MHNKDLKKRILEISFKHKLSHIGSCITAVDMIEEIYTKKKPSDPFILSCGHAGLAQYVVIEKHGGRNAEEIFEHHGVHPDLCAECGIWCSTGSLGNGLPIAVGMAFADRKRHVYCLISDGEMAEGSIHEAARIASQYHLSNLHVYLNDNGWAAYQRTDTYRAPQFSGAHFTECLTSMREFPVWLQNQDGHYSNMNEERYKEALEVCL